MTSRLQEISVIVFLALFATIVASYSVGSFPRGGAYFPLLSVMMFIWLTPFVPDLEWISSIRFFGFAHFLLCLLLSVHLITRFRKAWVVSAALFLVLLIANAIFFGIYSRFGVQYHGLSYVLMTVFLNAMLASLAGWQLFRARQSPGDSIPMLIAHATMLMWLSWVSLPMLGTYG